MVATLATLATLAGPQLHVAIGTVYDAHSRLGPFNRGSSTASERGEVRDGGASPFVVGVRLVVHPPIAGAEHAMDTHRGGAQASFRDGRQSANSPEVIVDHRTYAEVLLGAPNYSFRIGGRRRFSLSVQEPAAAAVTFTAQALRLRRHGWTARLQVPVLTDFQTLSIYGYRLRPGPYDAPKKAIIGHFRFDEYLVRWHSLAKRLHRDFVLAGSLDRLPPGRGKRRDTRDVGAFFLGELEGWRAQLAQGLANTNPALGQQDLNLSVQRIIDRNVFLRTGEARGLEFHGSPTTFPDLSVDILGQVYGHFFGKSIRLTADHPAKVEDKPAVKEAGGVFYTPTAVVDRIVAEVLGPALEHQQPDEVADLRLCAPACGSGCFRLSSYQSLLDWHTRWHTRAYLLGAPEEAHYRVFHAPSALTSSPPRRAVRWNAFGASRLAVWVPG